MTARARLPSLLLATALDLASASWWSDTSGENDFRDRLQGIQDRVVDISPVEVEEQQAKWGDGIVAIGHLLRTHSFVHVQKEALRFVEDLYGADFRGVIVKPTGVFHKPFRDNRRGVVSWLVGHDKEFPQDEGFATRGWRKVRFINAGISLTGNQALAMGNSYYTDPISHAEVKGEYTMGFVRGHDGRIRMNLHFSSVPYANDTKSLMGSGISQEEIRDAQKEFVSDILRIGRHRHIDENVKMFVDNSFAFNEGRVLFKPADVKESPFRVSRYGVYSYFGGSSADYPHVYPGDSGFAQQIWRHGEFENAGIVLHGDQAWAMGAYAFWRDDGRRFEAEYSIGYVRDSEGRLRMNLFSASVPREVKAPKEKRKDCWGTVVSAKAIEEVQKKWAEGIVDIGSTYATKGDYRKRAEQFVDRMYAYQIRPVLYKPADAGGHHAFRTSREGAISYFVGGDPNFPEDNGFALQGWEHVHFTNVDVLFSGDEAITMGFVSYAGSNGVWRSAEITMGFILDEERNLRINLQHATFPDRVRSWQFGSVNPAGGNYVPITEDAVRGAQDRLGRWVVRIGEAHDNFTKARKLTEEMVDEMYDFSGGQVLFNVVEATNATRFRYTRRGAISFFVGNDCSFPADRGFAVDQPWSEVRFKIKGMKVLERYRAHVFGTSWFCCDREGKELELEFVMGYLSDADGQLRLFLHDMGHPYMAPYSSWESALDGLGTAAGVMRTVGVTVGSSVEGSVGTVRSGGSGMVVAMIAVPVVVGLFAYFACCWNPGKLGIGGGGEPARQRIARVGQPDVVVFDGPGYDNPQGLGYTNGFASSSGAGLQGGFRGGYSRSAGASNGFASGGNFASGSAAFSSKSAFASNTAFASNSGGARAGSMGYQDSFGAQYASQGSAYANQYEPVPNRASPSPYVSGSAGSYHPQPAQARRPGNARGSWRTSGSMPQRMY